MALLGNYPRYYTNVEWERKG